MAKRRSVIGRRAWRLLRMTLVWARKGEIFRARLGISFNRLIRKLGHSTESRRRPLVYGDHEFSFGETPIVRVKMHRPSSSLPFKMPHFPCVQSPKVLDFDEWDDHVQGACAFDDDVDDDEEEGEGEGIDVRAEKFIADFYHQMKLQSQISYLE